MENCNYCSKLVITPVELIDYDEAFCSDECSDIWLEQQCEKQDSLWEA